MSVVDVDVAAMVAATVAATVAVDVAATVAVDVAPSRLLAWYSQFATCAGAAAFRKSPPLLSELTVAFAAANRANAAHNRAWAVEAEVNKNATLPDTLRLQADIQDEMADANGLSTASSFLQTCASGHWFAEDSLRVLLTCHFMPCEQKEANRIEFESRCPVSAHDSSATALWMRYE